MFIGQWRCFLWNIHHTVSISLLKAPHLFQHDTFFSIYWYISFQFILVLSFSMWPFYFYKSSPGISDFLTNNAIVLLFHIYFFLFDKPLKFIRKKVCHTKCVIHLACLTTYFDGNFFLKEIFQWFWYFAKTQTHFLKDFFVQHPKLIIDKHKFEYKAHHGKDKIEDIKTALYKYILSCKPSMYLYLLDTSDGF